MPSATYQTPTYKDLKDIFGDNLTEIRVDARQSDVDEFVERLEAAMQATKEHTIQFG